MTGPMLELLEDFLFNQCEPGPEIFLVLDRGARQTDLLGFRFQQLRRRREDVVEAGRQGITNGLQFAQPGFL